MSDRESAWARRGAAATGSRRVTAGSVNDGVVADIDALLAEEEEPVDPPKEEDEPLL
jgi:hypothetical protein